MLQILALSDVTDFLGFVWEVMQSLVEKLGELFTFIKNLITFIPKIFAIFPNEILIILIPTVTILVIATIYKFLI